jgi:hypothetical protein
MFRGRSPQASVLWKTVGPGLGTNTAGYCFAFRWQTGDWQMTDDKLKQDNRDRSKVSSSEDYEVEHLMAKYDISKNHALELILKHSGSRKKIEDELSNT